MFLRVNLMAENQEKYEVVSTVHGEWVCPENKNDIAIYPIEIKPNWHVFPIKEENFLTEAVIEESSVGFHDNNTVYSKGFGIGNDTLVIGRFMGHDGIEKNLPVVRFGNIAMMPHEPVIQIERNNHKQEAFLVESRTINGFSGSPVFVGIDKDYQVLGREITEYSLLGVGWGHFNQDIEVLLRGKDKVTMTRKTLASILSSGMMTVAPCWQLTELLNSEEVVMSRKKKDDLRPKSGNGIVLDSGFSKDTFEKTLKKVVRKKAKPSEPGKESK